ncbi:Uncharacterised protein [Gallibacterium anatis]|uniref:DUF1640 domain-containing protein n=1 Tax=Gallibacterium anatis TaxID=750 RepID=A0A1A7P338_9PAST|nr:DUF1640 domain-containing protein [Gallibacterium anatis]KGQ54451.1 hypothetical protein IE01_09815 [Gallibacterium anatis DSM 16844 = F 149]OBW96146.1 hypothetical protein QV03_11170 [Gallibacterium anatis]STO37410.1 Uncharacterised protein [Gallibacterium anatis]
MKDLKIFNIRSNEAENYLLLVASFGKIGLSPELSIELAQNLRKVIMDSQKDLVTRQEFQQAHQELKDEIQEVRAEIQAVRTELKSEIQELRVEIKEVKTDFYKAINRLTFAIITFVVAIVGALLTYISLAN